MKELLSNKLTTRELAIELKRSPETLERWRRLRIGPPFLRLQGRVLYDRQQVENWLHEQSSQAGAA
jgi:hypothetical protein